MTHSGTNGASNGHAAASEVDIVVPVFNALEYVSECVQAVLRHADRPLRLILVNDGSDDTTSAWLREAAAANPAITLIEHEANRGYTCAINTGLRVSTAPHAILLNSDTVVTPGWLAGLVRCAQSDDSIGIVGPLSNAASWQSIPAVVDADGKFAVNPLPDGMSADDIAALAAEVSTRAYPRMPFVNGFCFLINRRVLDRIGLFDEEAFPVGYGEENDYCIRAKDAGFALAIADDVYVYHAKSKSFGSERRDALSSAGRDALRAKHGRGRVDGLARQARKLEALEPMRLSLRARLWELARARCTVDPLSAKVLFLLPVKGHGGGVHSVIQEASAMRRLGITAKVAVRARDHARHVEAYPEVAEIEQLLVPFTSESLLEVARDFDVVVATAYPSVELLERIRFAYPEILPAYYVQDYEALFFDEGTEEHEEALASYQRIPGALLFAKTNWIIHQVAENHRTLVHKVVPSLDHSVYYPEPRDDHPEVRIVAMVRPQTPRRAAARTMRVLREVAKRHPNRVSVHTFGCEATHPAFDPLPRDFPFVNYGVLNRSDVAALLRRCDVFVDLSDFQAFGRTGLEAMASGCAALLPSAGGTDEYAVAGSNAVIVDSSDEAACVEQLSLLVTSDAELLRLRRAGLATAARYSLHGAAMSELNLFAEGLSVHRQGVAGLTRRRVTLLPAVDENAVVSGAGYVRTVVPWRLAVTQRSWVPELGSAATLPAPGSADLVLLQAGSALADPVELFPWLGNWRKAGGRLLFDLTSDIGTPDAPNLRLDDEEHGNLQWLVSVADAVIVPSDDFLPLATALNPNVFVLPSYVDTDAPETRAEAVPGEPVRIGFIGSGHEMPELELIARAVRQVEQEFGAQIAVEVVGTFQKSEPLFGARLGLPKRREYSEYIAWLSRRVNWDIALLPLVEDPLAAPLDFKFFQYTALGMATIASDTPAARRVIAPRDTGVLTPNTTEGWYGALKELIQEADTRKRLVQAAREDIARRFSVQAHKQTYTEILDAVVELPRRLDTPVFGRKSLPALIAQPSSAGAARRAATPGRATAMVAQQAEQNALAKPSAADSAFRRKLKKLANNPDQFFADSKNPVVRGLGTLVLRKGG